MGTGQVWEFRPDGDEGTLTLIFESPGAPVLNFPDNITVSPQGALLLCEDAPGFDQFLRGVTLDGRIFDFAHNLQTDREWAGATFAVNCQGLTSGPTPPAAGDEGMTFAIWGPWGEGAL
jgi:secreted PhoX family phosphatase